MRTGRTIIWLAAAALLAIVVVGAVGLVRPGDGAPVPVAVGGPLQKGLSYDDYAATLAAHVDGEGMVAYSDLKADPQRLDAFLDQIARLDPRAFKEWNDERKVAFWINAYNGLTLKAIIDHYPIEPTFPATLRYPDNSIRQIEGVWTELTFPVMGQAVTLDWIEHGMLRKEFNHPRIHVALVCAAMGCPPLRAEPYGGARLDDQLDDQSRRFLADPDKFRIDRAGGRVHLSSIFKWFGGDFTESYGTDRKFSGRGEVERAVLNFIGGYLDEADRTYLETADYKIEYLDYDWTLNERADE